ncbi:MAG: squalene/phytoene synthase family protein, partial [Thermostichales cyanobacterium SRBZ-1_bins_19]
MRVKPSPPSRSTPSPSQRLASFELCRQITAQYAKTFYLGSLLLPLAKRQAIWAIYAWLRQTDEVVDGFETPQSALQPPTTQAMLNQWAADLERLFSQGETSRLTDLALLDTIERYQMSLQPFRDMILGQQMDLETNRYATWEDLRLYCYRVAGTVGLMSSEIMGFVPGADVQAGKEAAVALGIAMQLTNILRDVGEDARRGRVYIPLEDLRQFGYGEEEVLQGVVDQRWVQVMRFEIARARRLYAQAEAGIPLLCADARWPVWASLMLYRQILDVIER